MPHEDLPADPASNATDETTGDTTQEAYADGSTVSSEDLANFSRTVVEALGEMQDRVSRLEAELAEQKASPQLDPDTLEEWVVWLVATYDLESRLPARWIEQPHMFAELSALRAAWAAAMTKDGITPQLSSMALTWHEALQRAVQRWHDGYTTSGHPADVEPLADWVAWLVRTYEIEHRVPTRWESIPGCPEELDALRASYRAAYTPDGRPNLTIEPGAWHEALERCLRRLDDPWRADHVKRDMDASHRGVSTTKHLNGTPSSRGQA